MIVIGGKGVDWKPICTYREGGLIRNGSEITKSKRVYFIDFMVEL